MSANSGVSASPTFERYVGQAILRGGDSTVLIVGSNMLSVKSVFFLNLDVSATILEHDDSHLMLKIRTTGQCRTGACEMQLRTVSGNVMKVPINIVADKGGRLIAQYQPDPQPDPQPTSPRPTRPYSSQTTQTTVFAIGAHLL